LLFSEGNGPLEAPYPHLYVRKRVILALMCFVGMMFSYVFRVCMSVAAQTPPDADADGASSHEQTMYSEFNWTKSDQVRCNILIKKMIPLNQ
jgi:hypothetical protein